jgi:PBP1b-binding outer membrane lipoprotein LpoB
MRILSVLLLLALGAVIVAGCGGGETAGDSDIKEKAKRVQDNQKTTGGQTIKSNAAE